MRIVIDLQGAQAASRSRGIGRYSLCLALAMARQRGDNEVMLALNGLFPETIEPIRAAFDSLLPQDNIRVWHTPGPIAYLGPHNTGRRAAAELVREAFLAELEPDLVHVIELFEGFGDNVVATIGDFTSAYPSVVTVYDLIPHVNRDRYLSDPKHRDWYYRQYEYLHRASLLLAISESTRQEAVKHLGRPESEIVVTGCAADYRFKPLSLNAAQTAGVMRHHGITRPFVLSVTADDFRKNLEGLICAFAKLPNSVRLNHQLVIVGQFSPERREAFLQLAVERGLSPDEMILAGHVSDDDLVLLYNTCTLFAFPSWHEGFGLPVLEAMSCGAPVIGANATSVPEVIGRNDALFDPHSEEAISTKLLQALVDQDFRTRLARHGPARAKSFSWDASAKKAISAFERVHLSRQRALRIPAPDGDAPGHAVIFQSERVAGLIDAIAALDDPPNPADCKRLAAAIDRNHPAAWPTRRLFVDVSRLVNADVKTGIQRVVRSILLELVSNAPAGVRIEPVYATKDSNGFRYAREFARRFFDSPPAGGKDDPIDPHNRDIFLGLDLYPSVTLAQAKVIEAMRASGVRVYYVLYDLLPELRPDCFDAAVCEKHVQWVDTISRFDGVVAISRSAAKELQSWLATHGPKRLRPLKIAWSHLGADIEASVPTRGMPADAGAALERLRAAPSFLIVGTMEPRKGHAQTLAAFELLWAAGIDVRLVLVGSQGWMSDKLAARIREHPEFGNRLLWLEAVSDEYLEAVYAAVTCLLAPSEGEGFGLPLIEAARHKLPILARDLPVFREVAGEHAAYFSGREPDDLATAVRNWLAMFREGQHPRSEAMPWLTWRQSTQNSARYHSARPMADRLAVALRRHEGNGCGR